MPEGHMDPENYIWNDDSVFVWNDMNEPACFNDLESTITKNSTHMFKPEDEKDADS